MHNFSVIVITFNRKHLLLECINSLLSQSSPPHQIFIIDNASTDGTKSFLESKDILAYPSVKYKYLQQNSGGAGGFAEGIKLAKQSGADWLWLMDDDALPESDALKNLQNTPLDENCIYGSAAIGDDGEHLCWPVETINKEKLNSLADLNQSFVQVVFQPFLGLMINRKMIEKVGFPDAGFFLSGDDVDYCLRISKAGGKVFLCRDSKITHPMPPRKTLKFLGGSMNLLIQTPQRTYYNIRNKIVIARRYYGYKLFTQTLPGICIRFIFSIFTGPERVDYIKAYSLATWHGLTNKMGQYIL